MNFVVPAVGLANDGPISDAPACGGVVIANDAATLGRFLQPDRSAAIWHRQTQADVQNWLDSLDPAGMPNARIVCPEHAIAASLGQVFEASDLAAGPERD